MRRVRAPKASPDSFEARTNPTLRGVAMKKFLPVTELARDDRFTWISEGDRFKDPRNGRAGNEERSTGNVQRAPKMTRTSKDAPERSRSLMHGIFMGEVQALEAAGR